MSICTKCGIDKPDYEFSSYWHSSQKRRRTRRYCKTCFKEQQSVYKESIRNKKITQPVSPEPPTIDNSNNPNYYNCIDCEEWKLLTDFYLHKTGKPITKRCKLCQKKLDQREADEKRRDNGGSMMVPKIPNTYFDHYQKSNTFELMQLLGYLFDEETGIWWKEGVKHIVNGQPVFINIKKRKRKNQKLTEEDCRLIHKLYNDGHNYKEIAKMTSRNPSTVYKRLVEYEPNYKKPYKTSKP